MRKLVRSTATIATSLLLAFCANPIVAMASSSSASPKEQGSVRWQPGVGQGKPNSTLSGGRRGSEVKSCNPEKNADAIAFRLLVPELGEGLLTTLETPTLAWAVETSHPTSMTLIITHPDQADEIYTQEVAVQKSGIVKVAIPSQVRLQTGETYIWTVVLRCANGSGNDVFARSSISRILPPVGLLIGGQPSINQAKLYAERGIWYDALATILIALDQAPTHAELQAELRSLLAQARSAQR